MLLWDRPDDALGFEEYLQAQEIPVIRVPFVARKLDERVPEPDITGATYPCGEAWELEEESARLARMLQREEMLTKCLWNNLERMTLERDVWRRWCYWGYCVALASVLGLASVVYR